MASYDTATLRSLKGCFHVPAPQTETDVELHAVTDDLLRESMALVEVGAADVFIGYVCHTTRRP
jgi:hypothetical protein